MTSLFRLSLLCSCLALSGITWRASAQANDPARSASARELFEEGLRKADAAQWQEAADLFQRALALRDSAVIRYNLTSSLIELGKLLEASEQLRTLEIDEHATAELRETARKNREALLPRLGKLTIRVAGHDPTFLVLLDDRKVEPEQLGIAFPVDPGPHRVALRAGERLLDDEHVALSEGQALEVKLVGTVPVAQVEAPHAPLVAALSAPGPRIDMGEPDDHDKRKRRILWGVSAGAVAVAAGVVAAVLLAGHSSHGSDASAFSPGSVGVKVPQ